MKRLRRLMALGLSLCMLVPLSLRQYALPRCACRQFRL